MSAIRAALSNLFRNISPEIKNVNSGIIRINLFSCAIPCRAVQVAAFCVSYQIDEVRVGKMLSFCLIWSARNIIVTEFYKSLSTDDLSARKQKAVPRWTDTEINFSYSYFGFLNIIRYFY